MKKILAILGLTLALTTDYVSAATAGTVNGMEITVEDANIHNRMITEIRQNK